MDNQNLSAFIKVAETNSFSEAAFLLDVTQSTISKRIALLESHRSRNRTIAKSAADP